MRLARIGATGSGLNRNEVFAVVERRGVGQKGNDGRLDEAQDGSTSLCTW